MSDDTDVSTVADSIQDSVGNAVDTDEISSLLDDESPGSTGRELGQRIGREVGSRLGRELGIVVARDVRERKGIRTILRNAGRRLIEICKELYRSLDLKSNIPQVIDVGRSVVSDGSATDIVESILPGDEAGNGASGDTSDESAEDEDGDGEADDAGSEDADDAGGEEADETSSDETDDAAAEEHSDEASEDSDGDSDGEELSASDLSADEMRELKEDTYRELLESMSYRDLQSLAKDVGVKANLAQDEMTDRIAAEFSEGGEA